MFGNGYFGNYFGQKYFGPVKFVAGSPYKGEYYGGRKDFEDLLEKEKQEELKTLEQSQNEFIETKPTDGFKKQLIKEYNELNIKEEIKPDDDIGLLLAIVEATS